VLRKGWPGIEAGMAAGQKCWGQGAERAAGVIVLMNCVVDQEQPVEIRHSR